MGKSKKKPVPLIQSGREHSELEVLIVELAHLLNRAVKRLECCPSCASPSIVDGEINRFVVLGPQVLCDQCVDR